MNDLDHFQRILGEAGFDLEPEQPHISGERYLMAKDKFVLISKRISDGKRAAIKISSTPIGQKDIQNEKLARDLLKSISFAKGFLLFPEEMYWGKHGGYLVWAIEFIEQEKVFVAHTLEEQFFIALKAFEAQESFHATTYEHLETVKKVFPVMYGREYFEEFSNCIKAVRKFAPNPEIEETLAKADSELKANKHTIDQFCNHLVHTDFVPHNFRVKNQKLYILDCSPELRTVHFGNKYEGWARFLNYMVIHNPALDRLMIEYIRRNRGESDLESLRLMRIYKVGFLLKFYANSLLNTDGDLRALTLERIDFWHEIMKFILNNQEIPEAFIEEYKKKRDNLRSEEEKKRQREFAVA